MNGTLGVLLAAGQSRRFGPEDKLLTPYAGQPLVTHAAEAMRGAGCDSLAAVVSASRVAALLAGFAPLRVAPGLPMSRSFAAALARARATGAERLLLCLGDMPGIDATLLRRLIAQPGSAACVCEGRRLPPACIVAADFSQAEALPEGDHGARALIGTLPAAQLIAIDAMRARDVDRASDLTI